ncbi:hypothetical protein QR680_015382 [Steinernema hermaphroditum]|uniref:Uncharacterized protein n=1 Tax=Steinernema hermaphroditum TaxID=289476 RepID=A0AA39LKL6_9BILA|nr:hypothetical protein QR680_015382 [Steinernema hermaphroditum]
MRIPLLLFAFALLAPSAVFTKASDDDYAVYDVPPVEEPKKPRRVGAVARGTKLVDEVAEDSPVPSGGRGEKNAEDDYSEFADKQPANVGANHDLKLVTLAPASTTFRLPPVPEEEQKKNKRPDPAVDRNPPRPVIQYPRTGLFYQHYPWDRLPRNFNLNPGLQYTYPTQFQNAVYSYPTQILDYKGYGWYGNVQQHLQHQQQEYAYQQQYREYYNQALYHRQYGTSQPAGYGGGCGGGGGGRGSSGGGGCGGGGRPSDRYDDDGDDEENSDDSFRKARRLRNRNRAI